MDEITIDGKTYVSSKRAAQITGYAKDYVGQLCREGRVSARLVGRNWYVLEQSIRDHRFGTENTLSPSASLGEAASEITTTMGKNTEISMVHALESDWKSPNYISEPVSALLPTLNSEEHTTSNAHTGDSAVIKEMQSAWQDWFARTNELKVAEETLLESPEISMGNRISDSGEFIPMLEPESLKSISESIVRLHEPIVDQATPITLEKVSEIIEKKGLSEEYFGQEEPIILHRSLTTSPVPLPRSFAQEITTNRDGSDLTTAFNSRTRRAEEGRVIRERRIRSKKKPSVVLQAILLSIAGIALVVALIGTGILNNFLVHSNVTYAPIQYLEGQSTLENTSK